MARQKTSLAHTDLLRAFRLSNTLLLLSFPICVVSLFLKMFKNFYENFRLCARFFGGRKTEGLIYNKLQRNLSIRIIYET